jgi:hypothetical protein
MQKAFTRLCVLAGTIFSVSVAHANITYDNTVGMEVILAFSRAPAFDANRAGNTYLVDLGSITKFQAGGSFVTGAPVTLNIGSGSKYLADLAAAGITSLSTATYSLFAEDSSNTNRAWLTKAELTRGVGATPSTNGTSGVAAGAMNTFGGSISGTATTVTVTNSASQNTSQLHGYAAYNFGPESNTQAWQVYSNPEGSLSQVLDLFEYNDLSSNPPAVRLGGFDFNTTTGALRFSSNVSAFAVPEPSSALLSLLGFGLCAARRFRRPVAASVR